jgi:hypothetical protein
MHFYPVAPEVAADRRDRYERAARRRQMVSGVGAVRPNRRRAR